LRVNTRVSPPKLKWIYSIGISTKKPVDDFKLVKPALAAGVA
jgi:hypothetical protein